MKSYRFEDNYEKVYELIEGSYFFIGTYLNFGINENMSDEEKSKAVDDNYENDL